MKRWKPLACELVSWKSGFVNVGETDIALDEVDRIFSNDSAQGHLRVEGGVLYQGEQVLGAHIIVKDGETQNDGMAHMGTVDWIMVECETWSMIPLENLIAHRSGSHTKIAAVINAPWKHKAQGLPLNRAWTPWSSHPSPPCWKQR